jgi:hypothetical protein
MRSAGGFFELLKQTFPLQKFNNLSDCIIEAWPANRQLSQRQQNHLSIWILDSDFDRRQRGRKWFKPSQAPQKPLRPCLVRRWIRPADITVLILTTIAIMLCIIAHKFNSFLEAPAEISAEPSASVHTGT